MQSYLKPIDDTVGSVMKIRRGTSGNESLRRRRRLFRGLALALGVGVVVLAEGVCRLFGWGVGEGFVDAGFDPASSLFVTNSSQDRLVIRESRLKFFAPESFPVVKASNAFRVFCLGGSTVQGRPYSIDTAFSSWLELSLKAGDGSKEWEVINCGGVSYASYRLTPILRECLRYEPDLIILCTGHNEFLEERTYEPQRTAPKVLVRAHQRLIRFRTYNLLRRGLLGWTGKGGGGPGLTPFKDVDALLDYRNGLEAYHRDDAWREEVIARFESNVRGMVALAREAQVPLILIRPPSNLRDAAPFKSEHKDGMGQAELARFREVMEKARGLYGKDLPGAVESLREALALDDQYAQVYFELGETHEALGKRELAREAFLRARELDICPLRILRPMEEILARLAQETGTPLLDAHALIEEQSEGTLVGSDWLVDHVHPSIRGHQLIAQGLVRVMVEGGWVSASQGWEVVRDELYRRHFDTLDALYYAKGQQRLDNLRAWTRGEVGGAAVIGSE